MHAGTGSVLWSIYHGGEQHGSPLVATVPGPMDVVYFGVGSPSKELRAYDAIDGTFLWSQENAQPVTSKPAFHAGGTPKVVAVNNAGQCRAFDAVTGTPLWSFAGGGVPPPPTCPP